jgi:hypothetical protein
MMAAHDPEMLMRDVEEMIEILIGLAKAGDEEARAWLEGWASFAHNTGLDIMMTLRALDQKASEEAE